MCAINIRVRRVHKIKYTTRLKITRQPVDNVKKSHFTKTACVRITNIYNTIIYIHIYISCYCCSNLLTHI